MAITLGAYIIATDVDVCGVSCSTMVSTRAEADKVSCGSTTFLRTGVIVFVFDNCDQRINNFLGEGIDCIDAGLGSKVKQLAFLGAVLERFDECLVERCCGRD